MARREKNPGSTPGGKLSFFKNPQHVREICRPRGKTQKNSRKNFRQDKNPVFLLADDLPPWKSQKTTLKFFSPDLNGIFCRGRRSAAIKILKNIAANDPPGEIPGWDFRKIVRQEKKWGNTRKKFFPKIQIPLFAYGTKIFPLNSLKTKEKYFPADQIAQFCPWRNIFFHKIYKNQHGRRFSLTKNLQTLQAEDFPGQNPKKRRKNFFCTHHRPHEDNFFSSFFMRAMLL